LSNTSTKKKTKTISMNPRLKAAERSSRNAVAEMSESVHLRLPMHQPRPRRRRSSREYLIASPPARARRAGCDQQQAEQGQRRPGFTEVTECHRGLARPMMPEFRKPTRAMKNPMPAAIAE
jgi:hypothetical protein